MAEDSAACGGRWRARSARRWGGRVTEGSATKLHFPPRKDRSNARTRGWFAAKNANEPPGSLCWPPQGPAPTARRWGNVEFAGCGWGRRRQGRHGATILGQIAKIAGVAGPRTFVAKTRFWRHKSVLS